MCFELAAEQIDVKMAAREFAEKEFKEKARQLDREERFDDSVWKKAAELGFLAVFIEEKYGGQGLGLLEQCLVIEEFARVDGGIAQSLVGSYFGTQLIQLFGTEQQKERYLPPVCKGLWRCGVAVTEPDAGSDVTSVKTVARREAHGYFINGSKTFITNGTVADYLLVFCLTNPERPRAHERFSIFIVDTRTEGFEAQRQHGKLSIRCSDTAEITLRDVFVPRENLLGDEGKGFYQLMELFNRSRLDGGAALAVGTAQGALEKAIDHVRKRKAFGSILSSNPVVQTKIAEMATLTEAARMLLYRAAYLVDIGKTDPAASAMAKWYACEIAVKVADEAIQLHGGYGIFEEYDVAHYWRDAKVFEIFEGTKEIEKILVGKRLLGSR